MTTNFFEPSHLLSIFINNTPLILISIGVSVVILSGGIDISLGAVITILNVLFVIFVVDLQINFILAAILVILIGALIGLVNGVVTSVFKVPPLLSTFAMTTILSGIAYWILPIPKGGMPQELVSWYHGNMLGFIPTPIFILIIVVAAWLVIKKSPLGTWIYAIGNSESNAFVSGIPVRFTQVFAYSFAGLLGGVAALSLTANIGAADALVAQSLSMKAVSACVIGGLSLQGGKGGISGAFMGAVFLCLVTIMVYSTKTQPFYQDLIEAVIILAGVIGTVIINNVMTAGKKNKLGVR
jgi:ribose transport system permease protein